MTDSKLTLLRYRCRACGETFSVRGESAECPERLLEEKICHGQDLFETHACTTGQAGLSDLISIKIDA